AMAALVRRTRPLAVLGAAASGFGLLMDVVMTAVDQHPPDGAALGHHVLGFAGLVVLLAGRPPRAAPRSVRAAAALGLVALAPYVAMKLTWALGGTFAGLTGAETREIARRNGASDLSLALHDVGLDPTALLGLLGAVLLLALV